MESRYKVFGMPKESRLHLVKNAALLQITEEGSDINMTKC